MARKMSTYRREQVVLKRIWKRVPVGSEALIAVVMASSIRINQLCFVTCFVLISYLVYSSILKIEAVCSSETSVHFFNLCLSEFLL
jgi:hypothetical protein